MSFYLVLFKILDKKETLCQMMLAKRNSRMIGERLRKKCSASKFFEDAAFVSFSIFLFYD